MIDFITNHGEAIWFWVGLVCLIIAWGSPLWFEHVRKDPPFKDQKDAGQWYGRALIVVMLWPAFLGVLIAIGICEVIDWLAGLVFARLFTLGNHDT